ncbi:MAG: lactate utilization protein [Acidobacteriia bacterium]|nr:lactate utilization protein [Terriglobia bacterium]
MPAKDSRSLLLEKLRRFSRPASPLSEPPPKNDTAQPGRAPQIAVREAVNEETISQLAQELKRLGAELRYVAGLENLSAAILQLGRESHYKRIAVGADPILKEANLATGLQNFQDFKLILSDRTPTPANQIREALSKCQLGITGCDAVIAETATMVLSHAGFGGRSISLLPECHVVVAYRAQVFISLDDWMNSQSFTRATLPSCTTFITGPSRTADIEKVLVTGVHGPLRLVLMLVQGGD